ncbi:metallophosphoesterase family protein [Citreimonas salinaria]|uniref:3',5'-cyclic AMP phosphodiesterase CpdA n=1 Tax=Citreimonas salinaria TaxID=321339 RepID=A0A1H3H727_9RHOB|nr:metallophosphoesterase [Citreimonas salinaria]SDY11322.1 3',5'-cyclic AMP phosphodiesterase CpdA [Citreimonas salinaria]
MRLVLIADLHFGHESPSLVSRLHAAITGARPDLIVVAGDFVQRARASQYRPARAFVDELTAPWIAVPGNHDIPLFNLPARLLAPRAAFRRWIGPETEPVWEGDGARVIGLDTTDRWSHQRGRVDKRQIDRVGAMIREAGDRLPIILAHHPFHHRPEVAKSLMRGAPEALDAWAECGAHVILSGHLHTFLVEPFVARKSDGQTLQVHCGTSASSRLRGQDNDFAILDVGHRSIEVTRMVFSEGAAFDRASRMAYTAGPDGWVQA